MSESAILKRIRLALSAVGSTLFRNNVGLFTTDRGDKVLTGLCKGSSDLIGWTPVIVTPNMIGRTIAVFTAVEVKAATGRASKEQSNFLCAVDAAGGIAMVERNHDIAVAHIEHRIEAMQGQKRPEK